MSERLTYKQQEAVRAAYLAHLGGGPTFRVREWASKLRVKEYVILKARSGQPVPVEPDPPSDFLKKVNRAIGRMGGKSRALQLMRRYDDSDVSLKEFAESIRQPSRTVGMVFRYLRRTEGKSE